jgi:aconitate hydratase
MANLINFGILPLLFARADDYDLVHLASTISLDTRDLRPGQPVTARLDTGTTLQLTHELTEKDIAIIRVGGLLNFVRSSTT